MSDAGQNDHQKSSKELTGIKREVEKKQDKNPGTEQEITSKESPETVHPTQDGDPRVT